MFETFLNLLILSIMVSINCENPVVIRGDRVYRYVGNGSDMQFQTSGLQDSREELQQKREVNETDPSNIEGNIPESLLIQLKDISNASDFISNFLMESNVNKHKDIYLDYLERGLPISENQSKNDLDINEERSKITKLPRIGSPAGCIPEMQIIELHPTESHNELYFPSCVRISRCSGCCPSQRLHCAPISTSFEDITVIRVKYSPIEKRLKFEGFKVFRIEAHNQCKCQCIQKSDDCSSYQTYSESECRCRCANSSAANECQNSNNKYWDHNQCDCKCKSVPFCSTGFLFNNNTCRCEAQEEEERSNPSDSRSSFEVHRYVLDKRINSEIDAQDKKGLDVFKFRGINPDINEEFPENSGSLQ